MAPTPQREVHSLDAPIGFSTKKHKLGDPLPDAIYATANEVLDAYRKHAYDKGYGIAQSVAISLSEEHVKRVFTCFSPTIYNNMKLPGAPRQPLGEVSPNQRSRVVSARDHGISVPVIMRMESLTDSTCRTILKNARHQVSCITPTRSGRPLLLTTIDHRAIRRAIVVNPKITA